ncbi:MAG: permease, partial [Desulfovibrio sp.]|nr:permease [Desulfovibrio sp.]
IIAMAYAVAYPFGIFGIILTMMLLKGIFKINVAQELEEAKKLHATPHFKPANAGGIITFLVTNEAVIGKELADIAPMGLKILAVARGNEEAEYNGIWRLRLDDKIIIAKADAEAIDKFRKIVGDKPASLAHPRMLSIFAAILFGVLAGSIPVMIPGLPTGVKLGVAGGTLLTAIFAGRIQKFCGMVFYMTPGANQLMREIGILLFLACVGLHAGTGFVETVLHGPGLRWMGIGAIITFAPLFMAALFARAVWKINFSSICGMLAGSMTDPPALAFAMQYYGGEFSASAYSTVYPLTMILRILMGQLLVIGLMSL